jgi:hypothetical protein
VDGASRTQARAHRSGVVVQGREERREIIRRLEHVAALAASDRGVPQEADECVVGELSDYERSSPVQPRQRHLARHIYRVLERTVLERTAMGA